MTHPMPAQALEPNAAPGVHEKVLELLSDKHHGNVLDAPSGQGRLSLALKAKGFDVWALDIVPANLEGWGVHCQEGDLNAPLPFADAFFDVVVCVEGIEHLENPHALVREFRRVLKNEATLVVTTPNIQNLMSRLKFFLFGSFRYFNAKVDIADRSLAGHVTPLSFTQLQMILARNGFETGAVATNRLMQPFGGRALLALSRFINQCFNRALHEALGTPELFFGDILVIQAQAREKT